MHLIPWEPYGWRIARLRWRALVRLGCEPEAKSRRGVCEIVGCPNSYGGTQREKLHWPRRDQTLVYVSARGALCAECNTKARQEDLIEILCVDSKRRLVPATTGERLLRLPKEQRF